MSYKIDPAKCTGCQACNHCPVDAITYDEKNCNRGTINSAMCINCGMCAASCPYDAVSVDY
ncbi:MAG: 4Fe-4S binding protein [Rickettsiales bacterium]|nr:4Fe-4S binding protein [Rickettsiales bacterium]